MSATETSSATRSRLLHDKVTSPRLRATSAVMHLCQEKTGIKKEGLRQDSDRQRTVTGEGGGRIKRTPEITKAFERQMQYRGRRRDYRVGESKARGGCYK